MHAFEVDRSLEGPLEATLQGDPRVTLHFQDVLKARAGRPRPAAHPVRQQPALLGGGPVRDRVSAAAARRAPLLRHGAAGGGRAHDGGRPGTKAYGVLSVWVQLYTRVVRVRPLARSIFYPQPHVDSSLVVLERLPAERAAGGASGCAAGGHPGGLRPAAQDPGQLPLRGAGSVAGAGARSWSTALGLPADVRAERLEPRQFVELAERLTQA